MRMDLNSLHCAVVRIRSFQAKTMVYWPHNSEEPFQMANAAPKHHFCQEEALLNDFKSIDKQMSCPT